MNQSIGLTGRARRFSRRLSGGITKALTDWHLGKKNYHKDFLKLFKLAILYYRETSIKQIPDLSSVFFSF